MHLRGAAIEEWPVCVKSEVTNTAALCFVKPEKPVPLTTSQGAAVHCNLLLLSLLVTPSKTFPFKHENRSDVHCRQSPQEAAGEVFITKQWSLNGVPFGLKRTVVKRACIDLEINLLRSMIHYGLVVWGPGQKTPLMVPQLIGSNQLFTGLSLFVAGHDYSKNVLQFAKNTQKNITW